MWTVIPQIGSVDSFTYFAGSSSKCFAQRVLQNRIISSACSRRLPGFSGLTSIPQMGSLPGFETSLQFSWLISEWPVGCSPCWSKSTIIRAEPELLAIALSRGRSVGFFHLHSADRIKCISSSASEAFLVVRQPPRHQQNAHGDESSSCRSTAAAV